MILSTSFKARSLLSPSSLGQDEERILMREFKELQKRQMKDWLKANKANKGNRVEKRSKLNELKRKQQQDEVTFLENALKRRQELERDTQQQQADQLTSLSQQVRFLVTHSPRVHSDSLPCPALPFITVSASNPMTLLTPPPPAHHGQGKHVKRSEAEDREPQGTT